MSLRGIGSRGPGGLSTGALTGRHAGMARKIEAFFQAICSCFFSPAPGKRMAQIIARLYNGIGLSERVVLNAFRHHRLLRASARWGRRRVLPCSTPFGITDYCAQNPVLARTLGFGAQRLSASQIIAHTRKGPKTQFCKVLNAFRHHRLLRLGDGPWPLLISMCSTPFGITDYCATLSGAISALGNGAQRLSASQIIAPDIAQREVVHIEQCSTPFGITDYCARCV